MKRKALQIMLAITLLAVVGCAGLIKNSYTSLAVSKTTYYTAMGAVADFQAQGLISQTQRDQINKVAKIFKDAHNVATDALEVYKKTSSVGDKEKLITAIASAASKWADVARLINAIKPNTVPEKFGR